MDNNQRKDETLQNILNAIDMPQVTVSPRKRFYQKCIRFISNNWVTGISYIVLGIVLTVLVCHLFAALSGSKSEFLVTDHYVENGYFYVSVEGGKIDKNASYMAESDGKILCRPTVDKDKDTACFSLNGSEVNIFLYSTDGRVIQMILKENP